MSRKQSIAAGIVGVLLFVIFVIGFASTGNTPDANASTGKVIAYFHDHRNTQLVFSFVFAIVGIMFVFFAGGIWARMKQADRPIPMLQMAFAVGVASFVIGVFALAAVTFALVDLVNKAAIAPATLQTLNVLSVEFFFPLIGGVALMGIGVGLYGIIANAVHKGFAWPALIIGIVAITPAGFLGMLAFMIWTLAFAIYLLMNGGKEPVVATAREPIPAPAV